MALASHDLEIIYFHMSTMKYEPGSLGLTIASTLALGLLLASVGFGWSQVRAPAQLRFSEFAQGRGQSCQLPPDGLIYLRHWG